MSPEQQQAADKGTDAAADGALGSPSINVTTGSVIQFENENYVSQAQFTAGLATAAQQGAKIGEAQMLRRMRMNPATRKQIGI